MSRKNLLHTVRENVVRTARNCLDGITWKKVALILVGAAICSFGIHNIHQRVDITEGGVLGIMLLIDHWLHISPALITPVLDLIC